MKFLELAPLMLAIMIMSIIVESEFSEGDDFAEDLSSGIMKNNDSVQYEDEYEYENEDAL
jgi:hypothetical protein